MSTEINKGEYLQEVLDSLNMKHVDTLVQKYLKKRDKVKEGLDQKYADKKATSAINSGSRAKCDEINTKFDLDLCQPFKYCAFETLEAMADDVYNYFMNEYEDAELIKLEIRKQRVSIGLTFLIDGDKIKMDVVPGRELAEGQYATDGNLNLHVRAKLDKPATSTQTNIKKHIDHIKGRNEEREVIRLLKNWKTHHGKDVKSFFIELITIRAFENASSVPSGLWEKLKMTLEYIRDKVESIRLEDPANSNNVVSDTMNASEKKNLSDDMKRMLEQINQNAEMLRMYFPINDKFAAKKDSKKSHTELKTNSFG